MRGACSTDGRNEKCTQYFGLEIPNGRNHLEDLGVDEIRYITMYFRETDWKGVDWIHLSQDGDQY
jgi:hypothetical protein